MLYHDNKDKFVMTLPMGRIYKGSKLLHGFWALLQDQGYYSVYYRV